MSSRNLGLAREGSKVRLIGLKNPELNMKIGHVSSYTRDGERVMIKLIDGPQGLVKVKPKQMEVIEEAQAGGRGGRPGLHQRPRSRRQMGGGGQSQSRERNNVNGNGGSSRDFNGSQARSMDRNGGMARSVHSATRSVASQLSVEVMETLRSADAMFDLADTSGDGMISQEEFEFYMTKHTNHDKKMIRECFYMIDVDHNGDITRDEVRGAFLKKRRELKGGGDETGSKKNFEDELLGVSRDADLLFDRADIDRNGTLSIKEFELYMKRNTNHSDAAIHSIFDQMDGDSDGYITREEVRKARYPVRNHVLCHGRRFRVQLTPTTRQVSQRIECLRYFESNNGQTRQRKRCAVSDKDELSGCVHCAKRDFTR